MRRFVTPALAIPIFFFLAGLAFIPKAGIHYDASYELGCFYSCVTPAFNASRTCAAHSNCAVQ